MLEAGDEVRGTLHMLLNLLISSQYQPAPGDGVDIEEALCNTTADHAHYIGKYEGMECRVRLDGKLVDTCKMRTGLLKRD